MKIRYILFLIVIVLIITFIYLFKPFKLEKILSSQIASSNIANIKINEIINAFTSYDYTVDNANQIIEIYDKLSNLKVSKCIFPPKDYSIQPEKTYRITFIVLIKL